MARRFYCRSPDCDQKIFAEPLAGVVRRHGRSTERFRQTLTLMGYALGVPEPVLHRGCEELASPICLNALNGKGQPFDDAFQEKQCVRCCAARIQSEYANAGAVVNGRVLITSGADLAGIHLQRSPGISFA
jgi:hypothetical protein